MARVTVLPETFTMVLFESPEIARKASEVADKVGIPADIELRIEVDERTPLGRTEVLSLDPIVITAESGALEDAKRPRHLSERSLEDVLGRLLFRVKDRLDPGFGDPPSDSELTLPQQTAWDAYCVGRCEALGLAVQEPRRRYHFRNRHGFTDVADEVFDRLWSSRSLTWTDIEAACAETRAAAEPAA